MIKHIKCNIFESGADVICHQVNCQGVMGSGIAKQVKERYPVVYKRYKIVCDCDTHPLGNVLFVPVDNNKDIANLFSQDKYGYNGSLYTDYNALKNCLVEIYNTYINTNKTIAFPYLMSCARGGGDWNVVYKMIEDMFKDYDGDILICEYDGE